MHDEGPSSEDLERFGGDTIPCPKCGHNVYDESPQCPSCGYWLNSRQRNAAEVQHWPSWLIIVLAILVVLGLLWWRI